MYAKLKRLQLDTFGLTYKERVILYKGLIQSLYRYGSTIYINDKIIGSVNKHQRKFVLNVSSLYRTFPTLAANVISNIIPLDHFIIGKSIIISEYRIVRTASVLKIANFLMLTVPE